MSTDDPYRTLGVDRDASPDTIKRAFRRLAMRYHPDRNPDDPAAERRFKEVTAAYELLSDPFRRMQYDRFGRVVTEGRPPGFGPDGVDVRELFDHLMTEAFGTNPFRGRRDGPRGGEDVTASVTVTLDDVARGTTREVDVRVLRSCQACGGTGKDRDEGRITCPDCGGSGKARRRGLPWSGGRCRRCRGEGTVSSLPCAACGGQGRVEGERHLEVRVPAGVRTGQRLKVRGRGNAGTRGGGTGDLFVLVHVEEHPYFQRNGKDVHCRLPVSVVDLVLGREIPVPTLRGRAVIRVPPGTQPDQVLTMRGHGLPGPRGGRPGDQRVRLVLELPAQLDEEGRRAVEAAAPALDPGATELRRQVLDLLGQMG